MPTLKWSITKSAPAYSNISKKCQLCMQEKTENINYPNPNELLLKKSELISANTLTSFYCQIINVRIRTYENVMKIVPSEIYNNISTVK